MKPRRSAAKGVALDLSGVLYVGHEVVAGAIEAVHRLREAGIAIRFVTNVTRRSPSSIRSHLAALGFDVAPGELVTVTDAARSYLAKHRLNAYPLVHPELLPSFTTNEQRPLDAVLVGDAGEFFTFDSLNAAFRVLMNGGELLAMGDNRYFQDHDGLSLDIGPFVRALEYASGRQATVLGKPSTAFFLEAAQSMGCEPSDVVMIGDDADADVIGALNAGMRGVLVRTGKYRTGDDERLARTCAVVCADIGEAVGAILDGG